MRPHRNIAWFVVGAALIGVLGLGLWKLFDLRFSAGDIYPEYSTLNTGPTGGKAIFESLHAMDGFEIEQNFVPVTRLKNLEGVTLVLAGAGEGFFGRSSERNFEKFEELLEQGVHVIATLSTPGIPPWTDHEVDQPIEDLWRPGDIGLPGDDAHDVTAAERWEFAFIRAIDKNHQPREGWVAAPAETSPAVTGLDEAGPGSTTPATLPQWFSAWRFVPKGIQWQTLATVDDKPVIIRRNFGTGSLTLLSDSTFLSNEALWRAPHPEFLLWLFGDRSRVLFDETHHGTHTDPGVMHLVRRYRLTGLLAGVAVLLVLFVWRASMSLVPAAGDQRPGASGMIDSADATVGMRNLMRQNISPKQLLALCFTEWAKSPFVRRKYADSQVMAVRDLVTASPARPAGMIVKTYQSIANLLRQSL